jgi:hypothetical protein
MKINITQEFEVSRTLLEDLIVTAIEGGSSYWYWLDRDEMDAKLPKTNEPLAMKLADCLYSDKDFSLNVYDDESQEDLLGAITQASCIKAFEILKEKYSWVIENIVLENWDANDADCFFQVAVMGEIVFG